MAIIKSLAIPSPKFQGRFSAVRTTRRHIDFCFTDVCFPIEPINAAQQKYCEELAEYVSDFISKLLHRCVPVFGF